VRPSWRSSLLAAALVAASSPGASSRPGPRPLAHQGATYRVRYLLHVLERFEGDTQRLATGVVSGPPETALRLSLRTETAELEGLLGILPEPDTANLAGVFLSRRQAGRSLRGLPLWEEDSYRRWTRVAWGGTARLYPFGPPPPPPSPSAPARAGRLPRQRVLWVEITVGREFAAGETRPSEEVTIADGALSFDARAVVPPRRVLVRLALVRGDTASSQRAIDLVPETPGRRVSFALGGETSELDVRLERPDPPRTGRDSALAVDADAVCLRVVVPGSTEPPRIRCGRLDNVARQLALAGGDTLLATFVWPPAR